MAHRMLFTWPFFFFLIKNIFWRFFHIDSIFIFFFIVVCHSLQGNRTHRHR